MYFCMHVNNHSVLDITFGSPSSHNKYQNPDRKFSRKFHLFFFFLHYFFIYFLGGVLLSCRAIQLLYRQLEEFLLLSFSIYIYIIFFPRPCSARVYSPGNLSSLGSPTAAHICYLYNTYTSPPQRKRRAAYRFPGEISCFFLNGFLRLILPIYTRNDMPVK